MVIVAVLGIGLLIFAHELGHFLVAKLMGVKVDEFMLGFPGPRIFSLTRGETTYGVTLVFFGGYCRFAHFDPQKSLPQDRGRFLEFQSVWRKLGIFLGGPLMNLILPIFLITAVLIVGFMVPTTTIAKVWSNAPAVEAGFKPSDKIISADGKRISEWGEAVEIIRANPNKQIKVGVIRKGKLTFLYPTLTVKDSHGFLGIEVTTERKRENPFVAFYKATIMTAQWTIKMCQILFEFLTQRLGEFIGGLRSPIGAVQEAAEVARGSILDFLLMLAVMSIFLGIFNFFPLPPLDGGRMLIAGIELIRGRPIEPNLLIAIQGTGMLFLLFLMIYLVLADIQRLIASFGGI
ncbi:MAG: M50 family metallopeptidase [Actinomycetota bacterium]|nr:M50 family metallopeptidase [Actinomycetota bacterium]